jgi:transcriptional regulator with XRE-family HTH domain
MTDSRNNGDAGKPAAEPAGEAVPGQPAAGSIRRLDAAQQAIGNFLRATRAAQSLTQAQVAAMTRETPWQLSRAAISAIERGQNFPGMEAMLALSNVLYVDPKELVERARLSSVVPVDISGISYEELDRKASGYFWAGDFHRAISVYDAMLEKVALEPADDAVERARRIATLEVRRATALKRAGALLAAIATVERAISLSVEFPEIQAEAYIVLAGLQCQRGHLPLANDAARRAVDLSSEASPQARGWAWMAKARVDYLSAEYEQARQAYLEARRLAELAGDHHHLTHIDGDIGICYLGQGEIREARRWIRRAIDSARMRNQPTLEASWLIELGRIALQEGKTEEADSMAQAALQIARPREQLLSVFRAEWLRHLVGRAETPPREDRGRLVYLRKLFMQLDQHEGIDEIKEFRQTALRSMAAEGGKQR